MDSYTCESCHKSEDAFTGYPGVSNYGIWRDTDGTEQRLCMDCMRDKSRRHLHNMAVGDRWGGYLSGTGRFDSPYEFHDGCSALVIPLTGVKVGRHNIGGKRYDFWFKFEGGYFWGWHTGDWNQCATIRKVKPWDRQ